MKSTLTLVLIFAGLILMSSAGSKVMAQDNRMIRIAKIKIDPAHLEAYKQAVKEQIAAAVRDEPGVLMLYAVQDKNDPANITVFEIYANAEAYQSHLKTSHFIKYKEGTQHMVKALELVDVSAIEMRAKKTE